MQDQKLELDQPAQTPNTYIQHQSGLYKVADADGVVTFMTWDALVKHMGY